MFTGTAARGSLSGDEPVGMTIRTFGAAGLRMSDGLPTPGGHDGQAVFAAGRGRARLIRNHELDLDIPGVGQRALAKTMAYDRAAPAGCTSSLYDLDSSRLLESFLVLNGTLSNCGGAPTPWGSWLSCEETTDGVGAGYEKPHGYVFEVPAGAHGPVAPAPLKAMGRFEHETAPIDPRTGIVYMTEDNGDPGDGFYRFVPRRTGHLAAGGRLQMLAVTGEKDYDTATGQRVGEVRAPNGAVLLAEDGDGEDAAGGDNWLRVLTRSGGIANLARVIAPLDLHYWNPEDFPDPGPVGASELAGASFTADGRHLFINLQYPGVTCVITGP